MVIGTAAYNNNVSDNAANTHYINRRRAIVRTVSHMAVSNDASFGSNALAHFLHKVIHLFNGNGKVVLVAIARPI